VFAGSFGFCPFDAGRLELSGIFDGGFQRRNPSR
jgi:hypothetical protein